MTKLYKKPSVLLHFNDDVLDNVNDIIPTGTTLTTSTIVTIPVKNHDDVKNKTFIITNKRINIQDNSQYDITNSFTLKWAEYITSLPINGSSNIIELSAATYDGLTIYAVNTGKAMYLSSNGTSWNEIENYSMTTVLNEWVRYEINYDSTSKKLYLFKEGVLIHSWTLSAHPNYLPNGTTCINSGGAGSFTGMIADFDFIKGVCTHVSNYIPEQINTTSVNKNFIKGLSNANSKFGNSMYLDGNSYLSFPNFVLDTTNNFTISINTYLVSVNDGSCIFCFNCKLGYGGGMLLHSNGNNILMLASSGGISGNAAAWDISYNYIVCTIQSVLKKWVNWEINYNDATKTLYLFKDGILINSYNGKRVGAINYNTNYIGMYYNIFQTGYYDEFLILQGKCLHTSNFTTPVDEYVYIPYVINKTINPYRLYGSINKSTITLNVVNDSVTIQYALYIGSNIISNLSYDNVRTINSNTLVLGTNTLSVQIEDGTIIGTLDVIVEEVYRNTSMRSFNDFDGGYSKKEVLINTPITNETIIGEEDINKNNYVCVDKFVSQIQNN